MNIFSFHGLFISLAPLKLDTCNSHSLMCSFCMLSCCNAASGHAVPAAWWEQEIGGEIGGDDIIGLKAGCRTYQDWWQWQWFNKPNRGFKFGSKLFGVWAASFVFRLHPRVNSSRHWACSWGVTHGKCSMNEWRWTEYQRLFGYNLSQQRRCRYPMSWTKPIC